jgi:hypothetical protein
MMNRACISNNLGKPWVYCSARYFANVTNTSTIHLQRTRENDQLTIAVTYAFCALLSLVDSCVESYSIVQVINALSCGRSY